MIKKIFFGLIVLILLLQVVVATNTYLTVKTVPNHKASISVIHPNGAYNLIYGVNKDSGDSGEVTINFTTNLANFNVILWVKDLEGNTVVKQRFDEKFMVGTPLTLELYPKGYTPPEEEPEVNETNSSEEIVVEEEIITEETSGVDESSELTGSVIEGGGIITKQRIYYVVGGFLLLTVLFFGSRLLLKHKGEGREIRVRKMSEFQAEKKQEGEMKDTDRISEAERKLKEAQEEINQLKNQGKIKELEDKINQDKERLEKLRKGEE